MPTIKMVVVGPPGVGKTSLRSHYISGRFSSGYRATIGADFITKTVPHPENPAESVTLQIWDTAGQERFSSLSAAFYRGADAVLLMFDVNRRATMYELPKWWKEFREKAPVKDEDMDEYCCVVVGNKVDLAEGGEDDGECVSHDEAVRFLEELVPSLAPLGTDVNKEGQDVGSISAKLMVRHRGGCQPTPSPTLSRTDPLDIGSNHFSSQCSDFRRKALVRTWSSTPFYTSTTASTRTTLSIYHTPSSSLFDVFQSARSSPEPFSSSRRSTSPASVSSPSIRSCSSSSGSAMTMTQSLFARESAATHTVSTTPEEEDNEGIPESPMSLPLPSAPPRGPTLLFTSAKTGEGVADVFEHVVLRVLRRWEYEERMEARSREASAAETVRLGASDHEARMNVSLCCRS